MIIALAIVAFAILTAIVPSLFATYDPDRDRTRGAPAAAQPAALVRHRRARPRPVLEGRARLDPHDRRDRTRDRHRPGRRPHARRGRRLRRRRGGCRDHADRGRLPRDPRAAARPRDRHRPGLRHDPGRDRGRHRHHPRLRPHDACRGAEGQDPALHRGRPLRRRLVAPHPHHARAAELLGSGGRAGGARLRRRDPRGRRPQLPRFRCCAARGGVGNAHLQRAQLPDHGARGCHCCPGCSWPWSC